jgi:membrane protein YdbS with pleckstrin-like domain
MRHRFTRNLFSEILKASKLEKIVLIIPFIVLLFDAEIFHYAWVNNEKNILIASGFVFLLSILEIIVVAKEIHEHLYQRNKKNKYKGRNKKFIT